MTLPYVVSAVALFIAVVAFLRARRMARRLDQVVESYWELRYDYGQLRARVEQLQGGSLDGASDDPARGGPRAEPAGSTAFVPLSSLRRT